MCTICMGKYKQCEVSSMKLRSSVIGPVRSCGRFFPCLNGIHLGRCGGGGGNRWLIHTCILHILISYGFGIEAYMGSD